MYDRHMDNNRYLAFLLLFVVLAACGSNTALPPTPTPVLFSAATLGPTAERQMQSIEQTTAHPPALQADCAASAGQSAVTHAVTANLNYTQRALIAQHRTRIINRTGASLDTLVFNIEPNNAPNQFSLKSVTLDQMLLSYTLTGRRLLLELPAPLEPGCAVEIRLDFQLNVRGIGEGVRARAGYFGHTPRQLNLGNWLPTLAARIDGAWVTREPNLIGEQTVLDIADWDVTLNITSAPDGLLVAGPGRMTQSGPRSWRFELPAARELTLSLSDRYNRASVETESGVIVEIYSFDDAIISTQQGQQVDSAAHALSWAAQSVEAFSRRFGPYPYERMVVVQADFPDGMEFTGLVFVGGSWFTRYPNRPASYLMLITVHEIAHQWWYAQVGSDQAMTPWLDESLATYSEYLFIEEYYPDLRDWWWEFRVDNFAPTGFVDSTVYQFSTIRDYINAVYLLGARMLHAIREDIGADAFYDLLRRYAEAGRGRIVGADVFWSLLDADQLEATAATRARYLRSSP